MLKTIKAPHIYLPHKEVDMSKYSAIACDQYTSNLEYWDSLKEYVGNSVSTFHMIYPEAYLENTDGESYINQINQNIIKYLKNNDLVDIGECFILVERITSYGVRRLGLVLSVDLEDYSYEKGSNAKIKASEATIVERIPPRLKIRKDAPIELPHILLLFDDKEKTIVEPLYEHRNELEKVYDFELNKEGGHIRGYKVKNTDEVIKRFDALFNKNNNGLLFIVGDGPSRDDKNKKLVHKINAEGTQNIAEAAKSVGAKMMYISTSMNLTICRLRILILEHRTPMTTMTILKSKATTIPPINR